MTALSGVQFTVATIGQVRHCKRGEISLIFSTVRHPYLMEGMMKSFVLFVIPLAVGMLGVVGVPISSHTSTPT